MKSLYYLSLFVVLFLISCGSDNEEIEIRPPEVPTSKLVSATKLSELSLNEVIQSYDLVFPYTVMADLRNNLVPVSSYKIIYQTPHPYFPNVQIEASGLVLLPDSDKTLPILSLQHGTIADENEVPSNFVATSVNRNYASAVAGLEYVVVAPDYLGYGVSNHLLHPYEHGPTLAQSSYDMLEAAKDFLDNESVAYNDQLFLAGYSEGGYATMALHQHIQENTNTEVTASIVGGGAYNKTLFAKEIMQKNEPLAFMPNYLWVLYTYNNIYGINEPFSFYINQDQLANINPSNFFDSGDLDTNPQALFTENFRNLIINEGNHPMVDAIKDNDRFDWRPEGEIWIVHGALDDFVFPSNATSAHLAMTSSGLENIHLSLAESFDHTATAALFSIQVPLIFEDIR